MHTASEGSHVCTLHSSAMGAHRFDFDAYGRVTSRTLTATCTQAVSHLERVHTAQCNGTPFDFNGYGTSRTGKSMYTTSSFIKYTLLP